MTSARAGMKGKGASSTEADAGTRWHRRMRGCSREDGCPESRGMPWDGCRREERDTSSMRPACHLIRAGHAIRVRSGECLAVKTEA